MLDKIEENSLIIVKDSYKTEFIRQFRKSGKLFDIKVMGLNELKKKFYFDFTKEAVFHVHKKYGVIQEIAEIYLENLYYLRDIDDKKVNFLKEVYQSLKEAELLLFDEAFQKYLQGKAVVLYDLKYIDKFYEKMFEEIGQIATIKSLQRETISKTKKPIYSFPNKEKEVGFVASKIAGLLKSGVDIEKIKLANVDAKYMFPLRDTFRAFHIPLELDTKDSIASTVLVNAFKSCFSSDMKTTLSELEPLVKTKQDEKVYKIILDVINEYAWCDDVEEVKEFIFRDIDAKAIPKRHLKKAVRVINLTKDTLDEDCHIFLINFNQGVIPHNYKDEDFLNDETKDALGLSDSVDLNKKALADLQERIAVAKNLTVTYSTRDLQGELYISNAFHEDLFEICEPTNDFGHADNYNKRLLVKEKDEFRKYGTTTESFKLLKKHYSDAKYLDYDNSFKGINRELFEEHIKDKLTLSYSSMNAFYHCSFRYYLDYIVKVDKFEDTFEIVVGNIFHEVLSKAFLEDFDFENAWQSALDHSAFEFGPKEKFFLTLLKEELKRVIEEITQQKKYTELDKALYEEKITVPIKEGKVEFKGFVDKIMYGEFDEGKVVSIVDYKTGNPDLSIDNAIYGLDMQLPIYAFLIKNYSELQEARIGGFYLQKILNNIKNPEKKRESLKLQGYSNSSTEILNLVDKSYADSKMVKSLRTGSNGFYAYSKVLSTNEIDRLTDLVKQKIDQAADAILEAKFDIDPKQIEDKLIGCKFCRYKDICYMNNRDIRKLKKMSKKDFLGGETDANMD